MKRRNTRPTTAIDLQPTSIAVTVLEPASGTFLARAAHRDLDTKSDPDEQRHHITHELADLLLELDAPRDHVAIHIQDNTTTLLTAELPPLKPKDLPDAIHAHLLVTLPRGVDGLTFRYIETLRTRTAVHALILTTPNAHLEWLTSVAADTELTLVHAQPRVISLAHAYLAFDPEPTTTTLIAHVGQQRANIALINDGALQLARITPSGASALDKHPLALHDDIVATLDLHEPDGTTVIPAIVTGLDEHHPAITHVASNVRVRFLEPRLHAVRFTNDADPTSHLLGLGLAHAAGLRP